MTEDDGLALSTLAAKKVMGWCPEAPLGSLPQMFWVGQDDMTVEVVSHWRPDRNIAQAFRVLRTNPNWRLCLSESDAYEVRVDLCGEHGFLGWGAAVVHNDDWNRACCEAILRACLKACGVEDPAHARIEAVGRAVAHALRQEAP